MQLKRFSDSVIKDVLIWTLLLSSTLTFCFTSVQVVYDYVSSRHSQINDLEQSLNPGLINAVAAAVWTMDEKQLATMLQAIKSQPGVVSVQLTESSVNHTLSDSLTEGSETTKEVELFFSNDDEQIKVGKLIVKKSFSDLKYRLSQQVFIIFLSNLIRTAFVAGFILFLFRTRLTVPLMQISNYASKLSVDGYKIQEAIELPSVDGKELQQLENSLQILKEHLSKALIDLEENQKKLLDHQKLETLGAIAANLTHDFKNLIQLMSNHLYQISIGGTAERPVAFHISACKDVLANANAILNRLSQFSRNEAYFPEKIEIHDLLLSSQEIFRHALGPSFQLNFYLDSKVAEVMIDSNEFVNAGLNLVLNARDAMPELNGGLEISTQVDLTKKIVVVHFRDNGIGMSKEVREKIFQPFFTTKKKQNTMGLGLAQVESFLRKCGGKIEVSSEVGVGTKFSLQLPLA